MMVFLKSLRASLFRHLVLTLLLSGVFSISVRAESQTVGLERLPELAKMDSAGLLLMDSANQPWKYKDRKRLFVPASTTKLVTAFLALSHWGEHHRFKTDFYLERQAGKTILWVKGYGDPFLISEELQQVAVQLQRRLVTEDIGKIDVIGLDTGYFVDHLVLPGTESSDNPYDAIPSAIAANFNTLFLKKVDGKVVSAEEQTPLTETARRLGASMSLEELRFNTGSDPQVGQTYFAELLAAFLRQQGVKVGKQVIHGTVKEESPLFYSHLNSRELADMIRPMMKYSTNFIANQLALKLAAEMYGAPADESKVAKMFAAQLQHYFDWQGAVIEDGAGLSRNNRLSPEQLIEVLEKFRAWKHLLPEVEEHVYAKSGSLIGVSALAGYIEHRKSWLPFVVMINQQVPYYHYRNDVAGVLSREIWAQK
ncbi:D-alanyl-D-alanine carboxypeptidase [Thiomicrorhabdus sp. ZW0627]|uniref:D-alanyl-D-alanine carboxypeptidase/D-alanyl-D-alanine-endopeptidase n=1 Tax=Thiomicrorhabdus sp. ZW0627 TaxID=3039774 RepID=UPI0024364E59|nr:D-alanyl-D-alanine carboxypeptidase [Thiomicrorhabdus sp. ZW0627]MDG6774011.1 D-alanyl-D-alanine carboxypeptidase [Thiomicrorhabdus sp. ZW0627]